MGLLLLAAALLDDGRDLTARFFTGDVAPIWARMTPQLRAVLGSPDGLAGFQRKVQAELGVEQSVVEERAEGSVYRRIARFSKTGRNIEVLWAFDPNGGIAGFYVRPGDAVQEAPTRFAGYVPKTRLTLPFDGAWTVVWGGATLAQNYHASTRDQRFALDLLVVVDGATHRGPALADHFAFGRPILAPADGTVVEAVDGLPDLAPGTRDPEHAMGNHVVIDHGNGEYSFLCHLQNGSVRVRLGQMTKSGDVIGKCGNSGNTSEPHLHYHLQNSPRPFDGDGLPPAFSGYVADGKPVARAVPLKGQVVSKR